MQSSGLTPGLWLCQGQSGKAPLPLPAPPWGQVLNPLEPSPAIPLLHSAPYSVFWFHSPSQSPTQSTFHSAHAFHLTLPLGSVCAGCGCQGLDKARSFLQETPRMPKGTDCTRLQDHRVEGAESWERTGEGFREEVALELWGARERAAVMGRERGGPG